MLEWPPELPQKFQTKNYAEQPPMTDRETATELGVSMAGVRSTVGIGMLAGSISCLHRQVQRLDRFYRFEAKGSSRVWRFPRPRLHGSPLLLADGSPITMADGSPILLSSHLTVRFKPQTPLRYLPVGNGVWWEVPLQLEWLPS